MTPQERQLIDDLFDRLSKVEGAPRDRDAQDAIADGQRRAPNAVYALVQTVLLQDEALKRANSRIQELESATPAQPQGGFLDSMRDALFGQTAGQGQSAGQPRGSVPSVRPAESARPDDSSRAAWNTGQVLGQPPQQQSGYGAGYGQGGYGQGAPQGGPAQGGYGGPFGQQQPQQPAGGGGSFLGTAAAAAAGMVGGSLLLGSIRSMMGGSHQQGFTDAANAGETRSPWSSDSSSSLANQAGVNDIAGSRSDAYKAGAYDQAQADADQDQDQDQDDGDFGDADSDDGDYI